MLLVFVDETSDAKFKDYFGLSIATINYTKYSKVKKEFLKVLKKSNWDESIEFKGSYLFSAKKGDTSVSIEERIEIAEKIIDLNTSKKNARMNFHYLQHKADPKDHAAEYLKHLPGILGKVIPKAPSGAGKNIISLCCDYRSDVNISALRDEVVPVLEKKKYTIFEEPVMLTSNLNTVGILYADIIGYLVARIDTISNDSELFEGLTEEQLETNGKIKKLRSSTDLISKIKNIDMYEYSV